MTKFEATVTARTVVPFELDEYEDAVTEAEAAYVEAVADPDIPVEPASVERTEALAAEGSAAAAYAEELAAGLGDDVLVEEVRYA